MPEPMTISVVIATHTVDRWESLQGAVAAAQEQTRPPQEIVVSVDHNPELSSTARAKWDGTEVRVVDSRYPGRSGSTKNSGLEAARMDLVVFIDDDVTPPVDLLERLARIYEDDPAIKAVGVAALPNFETGRPAWLGEEFDWTIGCTYRGLPTKRGPMGRMVGSCMSARREALLAVRGFHADHHDDLDISHRLIDRYGWNSLVFEPDIAVSHLAPAARTNWRYLSNRVYTTNRDKVRAMQDLGSGANSASDRAFVLRFVFRYLPEHLAHPRSGGWQRAAGGIGFVTVAALGSVLGRIDAKRGRILPSLTLGLEFTAPAPPPPAQPEPASSTPA
jgi:GT2 family glycosyltransferase